MTDIVLTILVNNTALPLLETEHGFAVWIDLGNERIMFDCGQESALWNNAARLDIDLRTTGTLVLSHGHYDHTGNVTELLRKSDNLIIHACPGACAARYSIRPERGVRDIAMPLLARARLNKLPSTRMKWTYQPTLLTPGIGITGPIPRINPVEVTDTAFFLDAHSKHPDPIDDDQAMWFDTQDGLVVLLGCCHAGLFNTLNYVRTITGIDRIRGIIGGMHLLYADEDQQIDACNRLFELGIDFIIPCHCTGEAATAMLRETLGADVVWSGMAGRVFNLGGVRQNEKP